VIINLFPNKKEKKKIDFLLEREVRRGGYRVFDICRKVEA